MSDTHTPAARTYEECLKALVDTDERFLVLTAENRAAIRNLPQQIGQRFIDVGICEQTMIGAAAGLALRGRIPIVHALASFLTLRAFEFIRTDVGIAKLPVKLVGSFAGLISEANGPTHQAIEDIALMRGIPNMNVWCPADNEDMLIGLETILNDPAPYYIRYNNLAPKVSHSSSFRPGAAEVFAEGTDVTILTYGLMFSHCHTAREMLCEAGVSTGLVNLRTIKPVDTSALDKAARQSRLLVTVEDHFKIGGLYSVVCEHLIEAGEYRL
jgi:transketolase